MRWLAGVAMLLGALALLTAPAAAHAVLEASSPPAGARLDRAPAQVVLTFDEPVETQLGSLRVLDAAGTVVSTGPVAHPGGDGRRIAVRLAPLATGRYVTAWRVVSADSHIVDGAFAFGVGTDAGPPPPAPGENGAGDVLLPIIHFAILAGALLGVGLPIGAATVGRGRAKSPGFVEFGAWIVLAFAAFTDVALRADLAGGELWPGFTTHIGILRLCTIAAAFLGVIATARRHRWWALLVPACALTVLSLSAAGHAATSSPVVLGVAVDALHLSAAAAWIGVLGIATTLQPSAELRRISPLAGAAVALLALTGIVQTLRNVGAWTPLLTTAYGRAIDVKVGLLLVALALAFVARRALARGRFAIATTVKAELWVLAAIVAATAVLVESPLPREIAGAASTAGASFTVRNVSVRAIASERAPRQWAFAVTGSGGPLDEVDVSVSEATRGVGPLPVPMTRTAANVYGGTIALPFAGRWRATVTARSGDFDENQTTIDLPETAP